MLSQISFPAAGRTLKGDFVSWADQSVRQEPIDPRVNMRVFFSGLRNLGAAQALSRPGTWGPGQGQEVVPRFLLQVFFPGLVSCRIPAGCGMSWSENAQSRQKDHSTCLLWLLCLHGWPLLIVSGHFEIMAILSSFTPQERSEPVVSSELLVFAPEPSEERKQRPRHPERHLSEQCHYAVHADKRGFHPDV